MYSGGEFTRASICQCAILYCLTRRAHDGPLPSATTHQQRDPYSVPGDHNTPRIDAQERAVTTLRRMLPVRPPVDALAERAYARPMTREPT